MQITRLDKKLFVYKHVHVSLLKLKLTVHRRNSWFRQIHRNYLSRQSPKYKIVFSFVIHISIAKKGKESIIQSFNVNSYESFLFLYTYAMSLGTVNNNRF